MLAFLIIVIAVGWAVSVYYNSPGILYFAIALSLIMNVTSYWYSDKIVVKMTGARPANRKEHFTLFTTVENLAITSGLPQPKVYIVDDPAPNAFATGRNPDHAVVAVTTGLLGMLDKTELEGVIAHELSHIGNRDMLVSTVAVVLVGSIAMLSDIFLRMTFWGVGGSRREGGGAGMAIIAVIVIILAPIAAMMIQFAISRKREYLADSSGALLTRYPEGLARALRKIGAYSRPMRRANHATAHLFLANPFGGKSTKQFVNKLFMTHPPVEERIRALMGGRTLG